MVVLDNDVVPSGTGGAYSEPHLYQVRGLQDGSHSLEYISMTCDEGGVSNISYVDFALSSLDLRTPIEPGLDMLLATYDDSSVVFSEDGGWEVVERAALERLESRTSTRVRANAGYLDGMETSEVGDWVSFSFFGESVRDSAVCFSDINGVLYRRQRFCVRIVTLARRPYPVPSATRVDGRALLIRHPRRQHIRPYLPQPLRRLLSLLGFRHPGTPTRWRSTCGEHHPYGDARIELGKVQGGGFHVQAYFPVRGGGESDVRHVE